MQITRRVPHIRSFKASVITVFALFILANITNVPFFKAFAPTVTAKALAALDPNAPAVIPADVPTSGDAALDQIIFKTADKYVRNITANYGKTYHPVLSPEDAHVAFHLDADEAAAAE